MAACLCVACTVTRLVKSDEFLTAHMRWGLA